jgi:hypothetical protein
MNGTIAQLIALVCHANAALRGTRLPPFFPANSTCKFCDRIAFTELKKPLFRAPQEQVVAPTPDAWFEHLRNTGAHGVRLLHGPQPPAHPKIPPSA